MDGRHGDWAKKTAALPVPQLLERIALSGFERLLIDRFGYADATVEKTVEKVAGDPGELELGPRWVFIRPKEI